MKAFAGLFEDLDSTTSTLEKVAALKKYFSHADAYLDEQIKMHESALDTLNNKLLPTAENVELKAHLEKTSAAVASHLEHAKTLRAKY